MIRAFAVVAVLTVSAPRVVFAQCSAADRAALEAFDKSWGDAAVRGDRAFLENVYAVNFMAHNPGGGVDKATTIANAVRDAERNRANPQPVTVPDRYMITCTATTATITHRNTIPPAAGSTAAPIYGRSVHFLEKHGNRWQVVSTAGHTLSDGAFLAQMELDWNDASLRRDSDWVDRNYASFATDVSSRTGALETKAEALASMKADKTVLESLEISDLTTRVEGDAAVVTGVNHVKGRDAAGKPIDRRVRFTDVFIKRDGRWQVWATQGTTIQ